MDRNCGKALVEAGPSKISWPTWLICAALFEWEQRSLHWYRAGLQGEVPKTPDEEYNWPELPALNHAIYESYKDWSLEDVEQAFEASFEETMQVLDAMTECELFSPNQYEWTGNNLLRDYVNSSTASHLRIALRVSLGQQVDPRIRQTHRSRSDVRRTFQ